MADTVEKVFWGLIQEIIDSRWASNRQHRFKNPFALIRLFQNLIPQGHFGYFFNNIGTNRTSSALFQGPLLGPILVGNLPDAEESA